MYITWLEIKRFLSDNKWLMIVGTLILAALFAVGMTLMDASSQQSTAEEETEAVEPENELESEPAYFRFYAEDSDGDQFTNIGLIRQYFNLDSVLEDASQETGVDIPGIEERYAEEFQTSSSDEEFSVLNLSRNDNNNLFTVSVNTGNEEDNLAIANFYHQLLASDEIEFLQDKALYEFIAPELREPTEEEIEEAENPDQQMAESQDLIMPAIQNTIIGLVISLVLMAGIALLKAIFGKKLNYSFAYEVNENDDFILYDPSLNNDENLTQFVGIPFKENKLILTERRLENNTKELLSRNRGLSFGQAKDGQTQLVEKLSFIDADLNNDFSEIIIIVQPYQTSRKWYKTQRKLIELDEMPVKVIQVNE